MSIRVEQLLKTYGAQRAINQISFSVNQGEIVGFLGPNGAGKSTTMKILTGYLKQDSGSAQVAGIDVSEDPLEVKKRIGYLPESNPLYLDMYVKEYLSFKAELHGLRDKKEAVNRVLNTVGLAPESRKRIGQLSKGYRQRVGLAAALIHEPEVLILDEPTSGLDPNQIVEIREVIRRQGADKTVLFSSHILQEVEAICDRVIIIHQGELVADDTLRNLRGASRETHLLTVQFSEPVSLERLQPIEHVSEWKQHGAVVEIRTTQPESVRKQLLELALKEDLNIVSLQSERRSLEEVFRSLTGGGLSESP